MDAKDAYARRDEVFLLDVREPVEWAVGHIEQAVHVPMGELGANRELLPQGRLIVCVCRSGHRSQVVTDALLDAGYRAENLDGGMYAWAADRLPIVTADGSPGGVA
jgi:rhodanese-related sulfurtransferase